MQSLIHKHTHTNTQHTSYAAEKVFLNKNQSVSLSYNQSVSQSISHTINQSVSQSVIQSVSQSYNQSISHTINQSVNQSYNQSVSQSVIQSISQSISHTINQSVSIIELRLQQFWQGLNIHELAYILQWACHDSTYPDSTLQCFVVQPLVLLLDVSQVNLTTAHNNTNQSIIISSSTHYGFVKSLGKESWWTLNTFN